MGWRYLQEWEKGYVESTNPRQNLVYIEDEVDKNMQVDTDNEGTEGWVLAFIAGVFVFLVGWVSHMVFSWQ